MWERVGRSTKRERRGRGKQRPAQRNHKKRMREADGLSETSPFEAKQTPKNEEENVPDAENHRFSVAA